jgi:hypothetical protein
LSASQHYEQVCSLLLEVGQKLKKLIFKNCLPEICRFVYTLLTSSPLSGTDKLSRVLWQLVTAMHYEGDSLGAFE